VIDVAKAANGRSADRSRAFKVAPVCRFATAASSSGNDEAKFTCRVGTIERVGAGVLVLIAVVGGVVGTLGRASASRFRSTSRRALRPSGLTCRTMLEMR
jgi:hypothetical protein